MTVPKAQHYVTQSYLRGFATGAGKRARVYVYERGRPEPFQQHPEKVARQNYYYSFADEKGELDHSVEEFLGKIESSAMPVLNRIVLQDFQPSWEERGWLAGLVALQELRVPWAREGIDEMASQMIKHMARFIVSTPGKVEQAVEEMRAEGKEVGPQLPGDIREMVEKDQYDLKIDPRYSLGLILEMLPEITQRYIEMKWLIARTGEGRPFITADNPVVRINPKYSGNFYDHHGIDHKNVEIRFPLNRVTALIIMQDMERLEQWTELMEAGQKEEATKLRDSVPVTSFIHASARLVEAINVPTARYAKRFVYAYAKDDQIPEMMGKGPGGLWPR